ncbi:MAG TPA: inositol monophosphatase, partial [Alphaproteobacteria bacterium]|nr:inositol monophosphatase [Alphaproteobacteria bacterium]
AWLRRPHGAAERLHVASPPPLPQMVGTVSVAFLPAESKPRVLANLAKIRVAANYRVAGHDYRLLASGHTHFAVFNKLMPWDHLAGTLIVQEAGGYAARYDGSAYLPTHRNGGLLLAPDRETWDLLRREVITL